MATIDQTLLSALGALDSRSEAERAKAEQIIRGLGSSAVPALRNVLRADAGMLLHIAAVRGLGALGPDAVPTLRSIGIEHENLLLRQIAVGSLERIGAPALGALADILRGQAGATQEPIGAQYPRCRAAASIARVGGPDAVRPLLDALFDTTEMVQEDAAAALVSLGATAVDGLVSELRSGPPGMRAQVARALGDPAFCGESRVISALLQALGDEDADVRAQAAAGLGSSRDPAVAAALFTALDDHDPKVQQQAAESIQRYVSSASRGGTTPIDILLRVLGDPRFEAWTRATVAMELSQRSPEAALGALVEALGDAEELVRSSALRALEHVGPMAIEGLASALRHPRRETRWGAAITLCRIGPAAAAEPLVIEALRDAGEDVRVQAALTLGAVGSPASVRALLEALQDSSDQVRVAAVRALGEIGSPAVPALLEALHDPDPDVRSSAADTLAKLSEPFADVLIEIPATWRGAFNALELPPLEDLIKILLDKGDARARGAGNPGLVDIPALSAGDWLARVRALHALAKRDDRDEPRALAIIDALCDPHENVRFVAALALRHAEDAVLRAAARLELDKQSSRRDRIDQLTGPVMIRSVGGSPVDRRYGSRDASLLRSADELAQPMLRESPSRVYRSGRDAPEPTPAPRARRSPSGRRAPQAFASVYHPKVVRPGEWSPLLAYLFRSSAAAAMLTDAAERLGTHFAGASQAAAPAAARVPKGAAVTATPRIEGFRTDPLAITAAFEDAFARFEFRLRAEDKKAKKAEPAVAVGYVAFTVEGALIAEAPLSIFVGDLPDAARMNGAAARVYQSIFCSYSHEDAAVVERVERAVRTLGIDYLRDAVTLKSGEPWSERLLDLIDRADIFQLFWSHAAAASPYVRMEWERALRHVQARPRFIRPVYWTTPMPPPPAALAGLHFHLDSTLLPSPSE